MLQRDGEGLGYAWVPVMRILRAAAESAEADEQSVQSAFESVQLLAQDFAPYVPEDILVDVMKTVATYGAQKHEINTALSAVSLLWNIADFVGRLGTERRDPSSNPNGQQQQKQAPASPHRRSDSVGGEPGSPRHAAAAASAAGGGGGHSEAVPSSPVQSARCASIFCRPLSFVAPLSVFLLCAVSALELLWFRSD